MYNEDIEAVRQFADHGDTTSTATDDAAAIALVNRLAEISGADAVSLRCALRTSEPSFDRDDANAVVKAWDHLNRTAPATDGPSPAILAEVRSLVQGRRKIEAIKLVRSVTNWGLKEAKDYVEALPADGRQPVNFEVAALVPSIINTMRQRVGQGFAYSSTGEDRELVAALVRDARFRDALFTFGNDLYDDARRAVADVLTNGSLDGDDIRALVRSYDYATGKVDGEKVRRLRQLREMNLEDLLDELRDLEREVPGAYL